MEREIEWEAGREMEYGMEREIEWEAVREMEYGMERGIEWETGRKTTLTTVSTSHISIN